MTPEQVVQLSGMDLDEAVALALGWRWVHHTIRRPGRADEPDILDSYTILDSPARVTMLKRNDPVWAEENITKAPKPGYTKRYAMPVFSKRITVPGHEIRLLTEDGWRLKLQQLESSWTASLVCNAGPCARHGTTTNGHGATVDGMTPSEAICRAIVLVGGIGDRIVQE